MSSSSARARCSPSSCRWRQLRMPVVPATLPLAGRIVYLAIPEGPTRQTIADYLGDFGAEVRPYQGAAAIASRKAAQSLTSCSMRGCPLPSAIGWPPIRWPGHLPIAGCCCSPRNDVPCATF